MTASPSRILIASQVVSVDFAGYTKDLRWIGIGRFGMISIAISVSIPVFIVFLAKKHEIRASNYNNDDNNQHDYLKEPAHNIDIIVLLII